MKRLLFLIGFGLGLLVGYTIMWYQYRGIIEALILMSAPTIAF